MKIAGITSAQSLLTVLLENVANVRASWYVGWRLVLALACHTSHEFRSLRETRFLWPRGQCSALDVHTHCRALAQRLMRPQWQGFVTKVYTTLLHATGMRHRSLSVNYTIIVLVSRE